VEDAIWHQVDDPALGLVDYSQCLTVNAVDEEEDGVPAGRGVALSSVQVHPNPVAPRGSIVFTLALPGAVGVVVLDVTGRVVCELPVGARSAGSHTLEWDGTDGVGRPLPSGVYVCRVTVEGESVATRFVLLQ
jgi:hypothetical protein